MRLEISGHPERLSPDFPKATTIGIRLYTTKMSTPSSHSNVDNRPPLPISGSILHSCVFSGTSDDPVVLTPFSPQLGANGTAPPTDEHTICGDTFVGSMLELQHGNEEGNTVEASYITQLRNLARVFLEGESSAGDLEVNLSVELLGFYEESLQKRQCIVDEVYVGQITHLLERIAVAQDLRQSAPKPTRTDLVHLLLGSYKNQFEAMVPLTGTLKTTLGIVEKLEKTYASREVKQDSLIKGLQKRLIATGKGGGVEPVTGVDDLVHDNRARGGSLSDKLVALNDSYVMLKESSNVLEKENTTLKKRGDTLEKKYRELKERMEKENKKLKHKNTSLEKGENLKKLKQRITALEKGNKEQKQRNTKLEQENKGLKQANDSLEEKYRDSNQANDKLEKENRELKQKNDAPPLESQPVVVENIVKKQDITVDQVAGSLHPSGAVTPALPIAKNSKVKHRPERNIELVQAEEEFGTVAGSMLSA